MNGNGKPHPPEPIIAGWPEGVYPSDKPAEASGPNYLPLNLWYPGLKKVFNAPPIYICEHFLTDQECDDFMNTAAPLLQRSKTHAIAGTRHAKRGRRKVLRSTVAPPQHSPFCNSLSLPCARRERGDQGSHEPDMPPRQKAAPVAAPSGEDPGAHQQAVWPHGAAAGCALHGQPAIRRALRWRRPEHGRGTRVLLEWRPARRDGPVLPQRRRRGRRHRVPVRALHFACMQQ